MNTHDLVKYAGALAALAMLSACGVGSAVAPSNAGQDVRYVGKRLFVNGRPVTAERLSPMPRYAMIAPDHHSKTKYEYVFNDYETYASIFDYPKGVAQVGSIYGDGGQGCSYALYGYGKKVMWNIGGQNQVTEYKVPDTPIKTLAFPFSFPTSCAMNTAGDLAVGSYDNGDVVIYPKATGSGITYTTPLSSEFFDGYDNQGNLFADGFTRAGFGLAELPKGSSTFKAITPTNTVQFPGSVQWDGTYVAVFDQQTNEMYQYTISGTTAKLKHTIQFTTSSDCAQTWIVKGLVYCGDAGNNDGEVFKYPAGGSAVAVFTGNFDFPLGVTAAEK